jgi:hypothetical protein
VGRAAVILNARFQPWATVYTSLTFRTSRTSTSPMAKEPPTVGLAPKEKLVLSEVLDSSALEVSTS